MNYPTLSAVAAELNAALAPAPKSGWNPELRTDGVDISPNLQEASIADNARVYRVGAYPMHDSGSFALEIVPTFGPDASGVSIGLADAGFDFAEDAGIEIDADGGWSYYATGYACHGGVITLIESLIVESGSPMRMFVNFNIGDGLGGIWLDTVADLTAADREVGINPTLTFPANTSLRPVAAIYNSGGEETVSVAINRHFHSGSFNAWS